MSVIMPRCCQVGGRRPPTDSSSVRPRGFAVEPSCTDETIRVETAKPGSQRCGTTGSGDARETEETYILRDGRDGVRMGSESVRERIHYVGSMKCVSIEVNPESRGDSADEKRAETGRERDADRKRRGKSSCFFEIYYGLVLYRATLSTTKLSHPTVDMVRVCRAADMRVEGTRDMADTDVDRKLEMRRMRRWIGSSKCGGCGGGWEARNAADAEVDGKLEMRRMRRCMGNSGCGGLGCRSGTRNAGGLGRGHDPRVTRECAG
ncbi:hypothetical protein FIBSPDRAFT_887987 [Athelia psychrophila]|uniref:Uncharacterized protein n=1 Tax=Athelia psychrophila TaxID=1759441 RepID=A0A166NX42_9AGAM|nr:hypothetical protein FIBSPDRAFT_887987 [Fibularhizoctonia sp. CBS 109695]